MSSVSNTIPNLINGVSQQPAALRLASQCAFSQNAYPHVVDGLAKAPGTTMVKKLSDSTFGSPYVHQINRDENERYKVVLMDGDIKVFDIDGNAKTVNTPDGTNYLNSLNPRADLQALTVADYTFILNKKKTVQMSSELTPPKKNAAIVYIRAVGYGVTYRIYINGATVPSAQFTTSSTDAAQLNASTVATSLRAALTSSLGAGWSLMYSHGPIIYITKDDGSDFTIECEDSQSNTFMKLIKNKVSSLQDLPSTCRKDVEVEIAGDGDINADNYFVKFVPDNEPPTNKFAGSGFWKETVGPGIPYKLDASTMPHALVREADGTFTFREIEWGERTVGDETTNKNRTFVGKTINDLFFMRDRLSFLSDENMICSRASEFFDFFKSTVMTTLDSDPIDKAASDTKVVILKHAVPFNETIVLFSDQAQFLVDAPEEFSQKAVKINPLTQFTCDLSAKPVNSGKTVLFTTENGAFAGVREYFVQTDTLLTDAADVSGHCPSYIPSGVYKLASSGNESVLFCLTHKEENRVYVYKYFWNNSEKVQSAWGFFEFSPNARVLEADFIGSSAYLIIEYPDGVYLERMDMAVGAVDEGAPFSYRLQRKVTEDKTIVTYNDTAGTTTITLPYEPDTTAQFVSRYPKSGETADRPPGIILTPQSSSGATYTFLGDLRNTLFTAGQPYLMRYVFSKLTYRKPTATGGNSAVLSGRLQVLKMVLSYAATGFFEVLVKQPRKSTRRKVFTGKRLGSQSTVIGSVSLEDGAFPFGIRGKNDKVDIEVRSDSFLPCKLLSAEWRGTYSADGRVT